MFRTWTTTACLLLVLLDRDEALYDPVDGAVRLEVGATCDPTLAVVLDTVQQLAHQILQQM
jgi:hypothetical protein